MARETAHDRLLRLARWMRRHPTPGEKRVWQKVRNRKLCGAHFYRQVPIGRYIVDFECPEVMLVVELDGAGHERRIAYDLKRKAYLQSLGYIVLRFGSEIPLTYGDDPLSFVAAEIKRLRKAQGTKPSPFPLPRERVL